MANLDQRAVVLPGQLGICGEYHRRSTVTSRAGIKELDRAGDGRRVFKLLVIKGLIHCTDGIRPMRYLGLGNMP